MTPPEPPRLKDGKEFHEKVQADWIETAESDGPVDKEAGITKPSGRKGRVDVLVSVEDRYKAVLEVKHTNWDRMTDRNVRRNVRRHIRQVWDYIESQLAEGHDVTPGIIYSKRPTDEGRRKLIEEMFEAECISVVWGDDDQSVEEMRGW